MRLIIDPGHGGTDIGASSGGYLEKDLNLVVAKRVKELLKEYKPAMTRTTDVTLLPNDRAAIIKNKYDYCLSIHFNAFKGTSNGVEAIHSIYSTKGKEIATNIVNELHDTGIPKRPSPVYSKRNSNGTDYYYMHRLTGNTVTVIVESLFIDNDKDKQLLNLENISQAIARGFKKSMGKPNPNPIIDNVKPTTLHKYGSIIHIFQTKPGMKVDVDLGIRFKKEKVSKIVKDKLNDGVVLGTNLGFFSYKNGSEHNTLYIDEGLYYNPPNHLTMDFIYYKDGSSEIINIKGYDKNKLSKLQAEAHWAIGTSYSLIQKGKINLENKESFPHYKNKEPRTMFGIRLDGSFVIVVTDGRTGVSKGLTAIEQAQVMKDLGCYNAVNVDGGGSSTMVYVDKGVAKVWNKLKDNYERPVGSVLLVYNKGWKNA